MSHFYVAAGNDRSRTTRCGTKDGGIWCHIRGWKNGVRVVGRVKDGQDVFDIYWTGGSDGNEPDFRLFTAGEELKVIASSEE